MAEDANDEADFLGLTGEDGAEVRLHPILSNAQVLEARAKARSKIEKERVATAMKSVEDEETRRLRREEGLTARTGVSHADEIVSITMDLAPYQPYLNLGDIIDGQRYWHGYTYQVPRHVADTLRELMARGWAHQHETEGKDLLQHYQNARDTVISAVSGTQNAPKRPDAAVH